jgi:carnitine O-acetyltransferase
VNTTPHKLDWDMVPELSTALRFAETRLADLIQQNEFQTLEFETYGKNFMTSMGFSPDAFVQMAFQAAYYGMYGRIESTYEPAMTKMYYHGRTEAIRPVTQESVEFLQTFWADTTPEKKVEALKKACGKHTAITKECSQAQGHDRHLYALLSLWQRMLDGHANGILTDGNPDTDPTSDDPPANDEVKSSKPHSQSPTRHQHLSSMPAIFADAGFDKINATILSTSNCGNPSLRHFGFGPTSGSGFGIGYIIKDGSVSICASSKHRQTKRYIDALESYFLEVRKLLRQVHKDRVPNNKNASRAREVEESHRPKGSRLKSTGRMVAAEAAATERRPEEAIEEADDELGGCKCFLPLFPSFSFIFSSSSSSSSSSSLLPFPPFVNMMKKNEDIADLFSFFSSSSWIDGFFDAGMLLQALKAKEEKEVRPSEKVAQRREVGKRLRLMEY